MTGAPELSIVIPAFEEAERLPSTLGKVLAYLEREAISAEVLVVDDGSRDATSEVARRAGPPVEVLRLEPNRGKGAAVRTGIVASHGRLVLISDADLSSPIEEWRKLERALPPGGVAIGSRAVDPSLIRVRQPLHRQAMGKTFNLLVRLLAMGGIADTQCGFKLFDGELARRIFPLGRIDRFAFDVEILYLARRAGARVAEIPVAWSHVPASRVELVGDSLRMLGDVARIRWLHRRTRV